MYWNKKSNHPFSYYTIIILIISCFAVYFLAGPTTFALINQEKKPSSDNSGETVVFTLLPGISFDKQLALDFFHMILGQGIPGMDVPCPDELSPRNITICLTEYVTGMNFAEPGSILSTGITGFSLAARPVSHENEYEGITDLPEQASGGDEERLHEDVISYPERDEAEILIYHSHITETFYPTTGEYFTRDLDVTVAQLGVKTAKILEEEYGIPVMHYTEVFDIPRRTAYQKARPHISEILRDNPQISMVIDLHRDGVSRKSTTANIDGEDMGKLLMVVGAGFEGWEKNFEFALALQQEVEKINPKISRGVRRQGFTYNQDLHEQAVLVEIGGHLNSFEEVERTVPYLAEALANTYFLRGR